MPAYRSVTVDGVRRLIVDEPPAPPRNPPLAALNTSYREADRDRRDEAEETAQTVAGALRSALVGRGVERRTQKTLRGPVR